MTKKCMGCGAILQYENSNTLGYIRKNKYGDSFYCEKCFKMKHYGKIKEETINIDTKKIIEDINLSNSTIIFTIDVLGISEDTTKYLEYFKNNKKYILLTKYDLLPKGIKEGKIIKYFKNNFCDEKNIFCISSKNKHNIDKVLNVLKKNNERTVHIVGNTNSGKSSFINALLSIKGISPSISVSPINNTTVSYINIKIDDINIIDTPGFEESSISNYLNNEIIRKITPHKELKVKTFQIKSGYSIIIDDILRIDYNEGHLNSFNFYMNNNLKYKKCKTKNNRELKFLPHKTFKIEKKDIVINGLGFIKINKPANISVYSVSEEIINIRNKMV